ncbi:MAG: ABC transporter ATP-binding protein [Lachnospiraceae bacterium]|nr:ABC transporter ATP-binding protein [Candidatus Equihabitans merdae]
MIELKAVSKSFGDFKALNELSMHVEKGSVYGLVGPNGAGKTTALRHITGVYRQDQGQVLIGGDVVYEHPEVKQRFVFIPDDIFYFVHANLKDMKRYYQGIYPDFSEEVYDKIRGCFPDIKENKAMRSLSRGMQKQAAILLALACRPEILIMDEPVDGLDPVMRHQIWSLIMNDVTERTMTVLVSSHNLRELEDVCDHVGIMHHGKIVLEQSLESLQDNISKVQLAFAEDKEPDLTGLDVLAHNITGRVHTIIIRAGQDKIRTCLACQNPVILDMLPLTLEEVFIYEMGGDDYAVKQILF